MAEESNDGNTAGPRPVAPPLPTAAQVPPELLTLKRWVGWRYELNPERTKWTKVPVATHTGRKVSCAEDGRSFWVDFDAAIAGAEKLRLDGVGFVLGDGWMGVDFDAARDPGTGAFRPSVAPWLARFTTYAEVSPSARGAHALARGTLPAPGNKRRLLDDPAVLCEMYDHDRYFTFTGRRLDGHPLEITAIQPEIDALHRHVFGAARPAPEVDPGEAGIAREFMTDDRIVERFLKSKKWADVFTPEKKAAEFVAQHYHGDDSSADMAFATFVARYTMNPAQVERLWRRSILWREKSAKRADYRLSTINRAMAESRKGKQRQVNTTDVADVAWLWVNRFPRGKLVMIDGDPGQAKSMLSLLVAVSVMTGKPLLDGAKPEVTGGVVLLSAEDDLRDTINPRLLAAGAPRGTIPMIHQPTTKADGGQFSLGDENDRFELETMIARIDAKLVIIDPLNAYLGEKVDSHNDQKIRQVLGPISEIANKTGAVVLALRHLAKSGGSKAIYRGMGSIGYTAAARANFFVADHPEKENVFVMAASKFNLGPKPPSLEYFIETVTVEGLERPVPRVAGGAPCALTANDLAAAATEEAEGGGRFHEAAAFLRDTLKNGETAETEIKKQAKDLDISPATLRRAKKAVKVRSTQRGRKWYWELAAPEPGETSREEYPF